MLSSVLVYLSGLTTAILGAMSGIVSLWPVAIMAGFLILGVGIGAIKKLAGARKGKKKGK